MKYVKGLQLWDTLLIFFANKICVRNVDLPDKLVNKLISTQKYLSKINNERFCYFCKSVKLVYISLNNLKFCNRLYKLPL